MLHQKQFNLRWNLASKIFYPINIFLAYNVISDEILSPKKIIMPEKILGLRKPIKDKALAI